MVGFTHPTRASGTNTLPRPSDPVGASEGEDTGRRRDETVALKSQCGEARVGSRTGKSKLPPRRGRRPARGIGHRDVGVGGGHHDRVPAEVGSSLANLSQRWTAATGRRPVTDHENPLALAVLR